MLSVEDRWLIDLPDDEFVSLLLEVDPREAERLIARLDELASIDREPLPPAVPDDEGYEQWIEACLPTYFPAPLAPHHHEMWQWGEGLAPGAILDPLIAILARGGAKSTTAEGIVVRAGARAARRFVLYVCGTQDQANDHVVSIQSMLERPEIAARYPALSSPLLGKLGQIKAWRQNRVRTASGFTVHALGLDAAVRGIKVEDARPDLIILDDIDDEDDSPTKAAEKEDTIKLTVIPTGSTDVTVLAVQNLIHPDSVFARLVDGRAEMLHNRKTIGPIPALRNAAFEERPDGHGWEIVAGEPTWVGQSIRACQARIDLIGVTAFEKEAQHKVTAKPGGMFSSITFRYIAEQDLPDLDVVTVWVDPAVTNKDDSDSQAIQVDGRAGDVIYRLYSWEQRTSPLEAVKLAIRLAVRFGSTHVGIETDQGGDTWDSVFRDALVELALDDLDPLPLDSLATRRAGLDASMFVGPAPNKLSEKAGSGHGGSKVERAGRMQADYERHAAKLVHVINEDGTHEILEESLFRFPKTKPLDLTDAAFWSWRFLRLGEGQMTIPDGRVPTGARPATARATSRVPTGANAVTRRPTVAAFHGR